MHRIQKLRSRRYANWNPTLERRRRSTKTWEPQYGCWLSARHCHFGRHALFPLPDIAFSYPSILGVYRVHKKKHVRTSHFSVHLLPSPASFFARFSSPSSKRPRSSAAAPTSYFFALPKFIAFHDAHAPMRQAADGWLSSK